MDEVEQLKLLLKKYLTLDFERYNNSWESGFEVRVLFDGDEIHKSSFTLEHFM